MIKIELEQNQWDNIIRNNTLFELVIEEARKKERTNKTLIKILDAYIGLVDALKENMV